MKRKSGFTLIELLIVIVIIGILASALLTAYLTITKIAFKVEQEKNITQESLVLSQMLQSVAEDATIDYDKYQGEKSLKNSYGITDTLYLTGTIWSGTVITTTGCSVDPVLTGFVPELSGCRLILQQGSRPPVDILPLTKVFQSKSVFKIVPYQSLSGLYNSAENGLILQNHLQKPGFWLFITLYSSLYDTEGRNKTSVPLQLFFNLNAPIEDPLLTV